MYEGAIEACRAALHPIQVESGTSMTPRPGTPVGTAMTSQIAERGRRVRRGAKGASQDASEPPVLKSKSKRSKRGSLSPNYPFLQKALESPIFDDCVFSL